MIKIEELTSEAVDNSLTSFINEIKNKNNEGYLEANVYKALMNYSNILISKYHEA